MGICHRVRRFRRSSRSSIISWRVRRICGRCHWFRTRSGRRSTTTYSVRPAATSSATCCYRDRLGLITANATTPYILNFFDLSETGPLVLDLPAGHTAGGRVGLLAARDRGDRRNGTRPRPGRQVLGGSAWRRGAGRLGDDFHVLQSTGVNIMFGFRTLDPDPVRADALVHGVRIYPYADREDPAPTRIVSPDGRTWTGDQPRGLDYWRATARHLPVRDRRRTRPVLPRHAQAARHREGQAVRSRRAARAHPRAGRRGGRVDGAGEHFRQAVRAGLATGRTVRGSRPSCWTTPPSAGTGTTSCWSAPPGSTRRSASQRR